MAKRRNVEEKGLSGIMSFSGTMLGQHMTVDRNPRQRAIELGEAIGCPNLTDSANLFKCLQNATTEQIGRHQINITFLPSVEAIPLDGDVSQSFLTDTPIALLQSGQFNKIPWLTGVNSAEAIVQSYSLLLDPKEVSNLNENWDSFLPAALGFQDTPTNDYAHEIRQFYFGDQPVSNKTRYNLTNMISDRIWIHPAKTAALFQAQQNTSVFMYYLTKEANVSFAKDLMAFFEPPYGVSHADEVQYFFPRPRYPFIPLDSEWAEFSKMFVRLIVSFANTSAPVFGPTEWPPVDPENTGTIFFNLDDEPKLIEPVNDRMELWDFFPIDVMYNETVLSEASIDVIDGIATTAVVNDYTKVTSAVINDDTDVTAAVVVVNEEIIPQPVNETRVTRGVGAVTGQVISGSTAASPNQQYVF